MPAVSRSSRWRVSCFTWGAFIYGVTVVVWGASPDAARGWQILLNHSEFLGPDLDDEVFDQLWEVWEEPLRSRAQQADAAERRRLAYLRYGLVNHPDRPHGPPMQYTPNGRGGWVMNCLSCHGGQVAGQVIPGLPNAHFALSTFMEDVLKVKLKLGKPLGHLDRGSLLIPLGGPVGTTNAVMFGVLLMNYRDADLRLQPQRPLPPMLHHAHDAPPLWHYRKKQRLYIDGFAPKSHRALMQFILVPRNQRQDFERWEPLFRDIEQWIVSLTPPRWPHALDASRVARGEVIFHQHCARCHGSYGNQPHYPEITVPIDEVGTDRRRYDALTPQMRQVYLDSWFNYYNQIAGEPAPVGYVAPPLDGVWASAPYFHNGSVPTLWHVLHPEERPVVWERPLEAMREYDWQRVGLVIHEHEQIPAQVTEPAQLRRFYDTRQPGQSASGHLYPQALSEEEKVALLEYLKSL
ncbi:MAG: hypothetical protein KatS3mg113_1081 [Planctomycetaceae bacterium]|nr:MAG: hypothetical protein KatS3mg113_1081 [Planctomycetaceae bacterium]